MIGRLCGKVVVEQLDGRIVVDVGGVGYEVTVPLGTPGRAERDGERVVLLVHTHVREDALDLYGFSSEAERGVFRLLIGVPNIGPRSAINVLSALPAPELAAAVQAGDLGRLTKVPGIGKKTAERLVLELKEKLPRAPAGPASTRAAAPADNAARLAVALTNMGYRSAEAERAIKTLGDRVAAAPLPDLLREALAVLSA